MYQDGKRERRGPESHGASRVLDGRYALPADGFFERPAERVARDLLGMLLHSTIDGVPTVARIVEAEAYTGPEDDASHASARTGRTRRNEAMFGAPGTAYVYRIYGIHWCFNVVTGPAGHPAAVLVRAAEAVSGIECMRSRRRCGRHVDLVKGPGNLASALGITGAQNGCLLERPPLLLSEGSPVEDEAVRRGPRVGVSRATDLPLRFWIVSSSAVSRHPRIP